MPYNSAAWIFQDKAYPLEIKPADYPHPNSNEVIVKTGALAINPVDWKIQDVGMKLFPFLKYPVITGSDVAGEVVEVGNEASKRFKIGDRVTGLAYRWSNKGAFQEYTAIQDNVASKIPDSMSYEEAAVIPLGISTAACGLFQKDHLALEYPSINPKPTGETILITGGSSSVGSNAIQLAVAAGYEVITTCSPRNFELVKSLGASLAFDYHEEALTNDVIEAFKSRKCAGALAIAYGSDQLCLEVVGKSDGKKFVSMAFPLPENIPDGVDAKFIFATNIMQNEVGKHIFEDFLSQALEKGSYVAAPKPHIIGKGLSYIQVAFEEHKRGVSAKKVVVSM